MPIRVLSWNMYYGNINNTSPAQRFEQILRIASQNDVDIVFLQEHPGITSGFTNNAGLLHLNNPIPPNYAYAVFPEMANHIGNRLSLSNRAYAIVWKNTCNLNAVAYFNQNHFVNHPALGSHLRCPVQYQIRYNRRDYNFFNWHNEVGNAAQVGLNIFTQHQLPANTVLVGDLNLTAHQVNQFAFFNNWDDVVVDDDYIEGVDHIMSPLPCVPVLGMILDFVSDANHFPIAADI